MISRALKVALQRGRVARNVATLVQAPTLKRAEVVPFTTEEARKILGAAKTHRNAARWSVALAMGLRQGEALGARWADVDLEAGVWTIPPELTKAGRAHVLPLAPMSVDLIREALALRPAPDAEGRVSPYVFPGRDASASRFPGVMRA